GLVRYADDWVVFCESEADAETVVEILSEWLRERGPTLSTEKTRIVHPREGLDFLGFNIRHYPAPQTSRPRYKLPIKPSRHAVRRVRQKLRALWREAHRKSLSATLREFTPLIRGWGDYYRTVVARDTFRALDNWMTHRAYRYTRRRHPG